MEKKEVLDDISSLIKDIDKCTGKYIKVKRSPTADMSDLVEFWNTIEQMSRLMVATHQELSFLYDHIKALYGLQRKADEVYYRAGNLSADINSAKFLREAREDYWHYVNYELNKEGGEE